MGQGEKVKAALRKNIFSDTFKNIFIISFIPMDMRLNIKMITRSSENLLPSHSLLLTFDYKATRGLVYLLSHTQDYVLLGSQSLVSWWVCLNLKWIWAW